MATAIEAPASSTAEGPTSHTQNQDADHQSGTYGYTREQQIAALRKLREPFAGAEIRFLPRVWCGACRNARGKCCDSHPKRQCRTCGQSLTPAHIDLRFVGHAEATNRLLNVDPFWDWEPLSTDAGGLPQYDGNRGLWIRLTVCGMTRLGYGHAEGKSGGDAVKEIIGDAIRNAGMRFGMALDLWTSSDLEIVETGGVPDGPVEAAGPAKGVPESGSRGADGPAAADTEKVGHVNRLMGQVRDCWNNPLVLTRIRRDAESHEVIDAQVQGPDGIWLPFQRLVNNRIAELNAASGGDTERNAA